jgi:hypothetical protein
MSFTGTANGKSNTYRLQSSRSDSRSVRHRGIGMNDDGSVIARRLAFLERELDRMSDKACDAEHDLRLNPTDAAARCRLEAIYALAGKTWAQVRELRARQSGRHAVIRYDRDSDASAGRAYRQALG